MCVTIPIDAARAENRPTLVGTVLDAATEQPLPGVTVIVKSPALQGVKTAITDGTGQYRISQLPPGSYSIHLEKQSYQVYLSAEVGLRAGSTIQVNAQLLPVMIAAKEILVVGRAPSVDVGSSTTGVTISNDFVQRLPVWQPGAKGASVRSFESLADLAPGVHADTYGMSIAGTSSPENQYLIDGISVRDPSRALLGTPLSAEFIKEMNVATGGLMPEYGRATGGVLDATTKSGSNELHGSFFSSITPGALEAPRLPITREGQTIRTNVSLSSTRDVGFELGGPILADKLWFYGGAQVSLTRYSLRRSLNEQVVEGGAPRKDESGLTIVRGIPGSESVYYADQQAIHYIGKLTYQLGRDHRAELSVFGASADAGGGGTFAVRPQTGGVEVSNIAGTYEALASKVSARSSNVVLSLASSFLDKRLLVDAALGWHHSDLDTLPSDGSEIGSHQGLSDFAHVVYRRSNPDPHQLGDFAGLERVPAGSCEAAPGIPDQDSKPTVVKPCPVSRYELGGIRDIDVSSLNRVTGKVTVTWLATALGHHVVKAGIDLEGMTFDHQLGYSGSVSFSERPNGKAFTGTHYGYLVGPDEPVVLDVLRASSSSIAVGGFVQDSWNVMDRVVLNLGVRYDSQALLGDDGKVGLALPQQWAPRMGVVYDFTRSGRSKLFASFARYYESVPLYIADRSFLGDRQISARHDATKCDPDTKAGQKTSSCVDQDLVVIGGTSSPNQRWKPLGNDKAVVDPELRPQSLDELVLGGEYEVVPDGRIGLTYTRRYMNDVIDDISRDEGNSYFIGNPGSGIARDLPKPTRDYDALSWYFSKASSRGWLAQVSYTISWLRGDYEGLFRAENGQFEPNRNSDYDLTSLLPNRSGPLPGDHTHQFKLFGARELVLSRWLSLQGGLAFHAASGQPANYLGFNPIYGAGEGFLLPRGSRGRLPWVSAFDTHFGVSLKLTRSSALLMSIDIFNLFNFQAETARDEQFTLVASHPVQGATLKDLPKDGNNPNFGHSTAFQSPRAFRFAARVIF